MSEVSAYISDFGFGKAWIKARREVGRDERDETEEGIGQKSEARDYAVGAAFQSRSFGLNDFNVFNDFNTRMTNAKWSM